MRKRMREAVARLVVAGVAVSLLIPAFADDSEWVYDTSKRIPPVPATSETFLAGLDAKARGLGDSDAVPVDRWFWTWCFSNELQLDFTAPGMCIFFR